MIYHENEDKLSEHRIYIGCAGWAIPKAVTNAFPESGGSLERYAKIMPATEINSTFYRAHKPETFARWAAAVPKDFKFAVKCPKEITHKLRLVNADEPLARFAAEVNCLGDKLGPILLQLPPSLAYDNDIACCFFETLRRLHGGNVVCEPRHESWLRSDADQVLKDFEIARVAADPPRGTGGGKPGGWGGLVYYRMHGSPRVYYSAYSAEALDKLAGEIRSYLADTPVWCIFDNTALGAAAENVLSLMERLNIK